MCLKSDEKDRYFWVNTDSSVRDGLDWNIFCDVEIEVPPIPVQIKYVNVYKSLMKNLEIYEKLKAEASTICPILVRGAIEEGGR